MVAVTRMVLTQIVRDYQEQGYKRASSGKTKLADWVLLTKERRLFRDYTLLVYFVVGDFSVAHVKDLCKRLIRLYKSEKLRGGSTVNVVHSGELDPVVFDAIYDSMMENYPEFEVETEPFDLESKKSGKRVSGSKKKKRKRLAKASKTLILDSQQYKCASCKTDISKLPVHFDHRIPLAMGGSDEVENRQALCPNCHAVKSQRDALEISRSAQRKARPE